MKFGIMQNLTETSFLIDLTTRCRELILNFRLSFPVLDFGYGSQPVEFQPEDVSH